VLSGGDSYYLSPDQLRFIGDSLLAIPHIRRFRIATKGICVSPSRTLDPEDEWTDELVRLSRRGRERGKQVAVHTHFNHPKEFSWVSREAAQKLFEKGVVVRNQSVLLRGVNDNVETMSALIRELADNNIQPVSRHPFFQFKLEKLTSNSITSTNATSFPVSKISAHLSKLSSISSSRFEAQSQAS
jgi:lysine 2,3-aminomutase